MLPNNIGTDPLAVQPGGLVPTLGIGLMSAGVVTFMGSGIAFVSAADAITQHDIHR